MKQITRMVAGLLCAAAAAAISPGPARALAEAPPPAAPSTQPAGAASLITLHLHNASAAEVYREIFKQAGAKLQIDPPQLFNSFVPLPPVNIDVDNKPFWDVIQQLGETTRLQLLNNSRGIVLCHSSAIFPGPKSVCGPFVFTADEFVATIPLTGRGSTPNSSPPPGQSAAVFGQIVITMHFEPRIKLLGISPQVKVLDAVDDNGNSMVPLHPSASDDSSNDTAGWPHIVAEVGYPPKNPGKKMVRFRALVTVTIAGEDGKPRKLELPVDFKDLDMNLTRNAANPANPVNPPNAAKPAK